MAGQHAQQIQQETTIRIVIVAIAAAAGATLLGAVIAARIVSPLRRLEDAATAVATGDLARRSDLADRDDEIGSLGRSFDAMAAELEGAELSRRRFFQDAAHELKTPLTVIEATTTAILEGIYQHDDAHLETIRSQARVLGGIVDDLRTISLAEAGELPLHLEPIDLAEVGATTVRSFAARAELAGVALSSDIRAGSIATGDRTRVGQVLAAYVDNALRHTPAGGTVVLGSEHRPGRLRLTVGDTGPGVPRAARPHAFDRFYQVDESRDRGGGASGSGLGLSIVRALVEAQGGTVGIDESDGGGACFWAELPAAT